MKHKVGIGIFCGILLVTGFFVSCKKSEEGAKAAGTTPIADLIKAGKSPVAVGSMFRGINPVAPTFSMALVNISDCPIQSVTGTVLYFDKDGKLLPEGKVESSYGELSPIKPGEKIELSIIAKDENAVSGKWIIKEVVYLKQNPLDKNYPPLPYKWTNPNYETELGAAENR